MGIDVQVHLWTLVKIEVVHEKDCWEICVEKQ